jgi:hypothetical protein
LPSFVLILVAVNRTQRAARRDLALVVEGGAVDLRVDVEETIGEVERHDIAATVGDVIDVAPMVVVLAAAEGLLPLRGRLPGEFGATEEIVLACVLVGVRSE